MGEPASDPAPKEATEAEQKQAANNMAENGREESDALLKPGQIRPGMDEEKKLLDAAENKSHQDASRLLQGADEEVKRKALEAPMTKWLFISVFVCAFGSSFQLGYNIGVVNAPKDVVMNWINESHYDLFGEYQTLPKGEFVWSIAVSIFCIGGMIGGLGSGLAADRFGRKGGMLLNNAFAFLAAGLMGIAKTSGVYMLFILGRFFIGVNAGFNSGLAPMYLTEVSPPNLRGAVGSAFQLVVTISILVSQIFGHEAILGNDSYWPLLFALTAMPAIFQVITLPFCPETPKYNLLNKSLAEQAEKDLRKLRDRENVQAEMDEMLAEQRRAAAVPKVAFMDMFRVPDLRWPLFIAVMMMFSQQFSGINAAMFYSTQVFKDAGLTKDEAVYATLGMGAVNVIMTVVSVILVDRAGRRTLHLSGLAGMWASSIALVAMLIVKSSGHDWAAYIIIVLVMLFVISFATGPGSIPWFYVSELFMQGARGHANSVAVLTNWFANFIVGLLFLPLNGILMEYTFLLFTFFLTIFWLFTWKFVPETKGIPVETVVETMKKRRTAR